jgi:hypothetical protein
MTVKSTELLPTGVTVSGSWEIKDGTELVVLDLASIGTTGEQFSETATYNNHVFEGALNIMSEAVITITGTIQGFGGSSSGGAGLSIGDVTNVVDSAITAAVIPRHYSGGLGA